MQRRESLKTLALSTMAWLVVAAVSMADESGVARLPKDTGAVIWTTDFPEFETRLRDEGLHPLLQLHDHFQRLKDSIDRGDLVLNDWRKDKLDTWSEANDLLLEALDKQVFGGEVAVCISDLSGPSPSFAIVAQTEATEEELQRLASSLIMLLAAKNSDWYEPAPSSEGESSIRANTPDAQPNGDRRHWAIHEGWFAWSNIQGNAERLLQAISRRAEDTQLQAERQFQLLTRRFRSDGSNETEAIERERGSLQFYFSPEWMSGAFNRVSFGELPYPFGVLLDSIDQFKHAPRSAGLDQLRSLGGRVLLGQDHRLTEIDTFFSIDAYLLTTQPQKGIAKAIQHQSGFNYMLPLPPGELGILGQIQVEGDEIVRSFTQSFRDAFVRPDLDTAEKLLAEMEAWKRNHFFQFDWSPRLTKHLDIVGFLGTNPKISSPRNYLAPENMLHFREAEKVADDVRDLALSRLHTWEDFIGVKALEVNQEAESTRWTIPASDIDAYIKDDFRPSIQEFYDTELSARRAILEKSKSKTEVEKEIRELRASWQRSILINIERMTEHFSNLTFCLHHGWTTLNPIKLDESSSQASQTKLDCLQQNVEAMQSQLGLKTDPSILFAFWSYESLYNSERSLMHDETIGAELQLSQLRRRDLISQEFVPSMSNLSQAKFIQTFDSLVFLASHEESGFDIRIVGVADRTVR